LYNPFPHQPEGVGRQDSGHHKDPYNIRDSHTRNPGGKRPADIHKMEKGSEKDNLRNDRRKSIEREEYA
jgi:hypothetical protein